MAVRALPALRDQAAALVEQQVEMLRLCLKVQPAAPVLFLLNGNKNAI
jgi:hypothetical protein